MLKVPKRNLSWNFIVKYSLKRLESVYKAKESQKIVFKRFRIINVL